MFIDRFRLIIVSTLLLFLLSTVCIAKDMTITVVYNNVPYNKNLTTNWGLSVFIEGLANSILFDTGGQGSILLSNMEKLRIDPKKIEKIVLSHIHMDHIGGLATVLGKNSDVTVYLPSSFPDDIKVSTAEMAKRVVLVNKPEKICAQVWSTGELGKLIKEQSLIIATREGLIVITGCAHPGIVDIVEFAKGYLKKDIYLVLGGFHLMSYSEDQVQEIIRKLKALGVKKVAPSHCTGGRPIELFREAWGEDFIDLGCGAKISFE